MKIKYFQEIFGVLCNAVPDASLMQGYLAGDEDSYEELIDFVSDNLKEELLFATSISIIEVVEKLYNDANGNGNIKGV